MFTEKRDSTVLIHDLNLPQPSIIICLASIPNYLLFFRGGISSSSSLSPISLLLFWSVLVCSIYSYIVFCLYIECLRLHYYPPFEVHTKKSYAPVVKTQNRNRPQRLCLEPRVGACKLLEIYLEPKPN